MRRSTNTDDYDSDDSFTDNNEESNEDHEEMLREQTVHGSIHERTIGKKLTFHTKSGFDFEVHRVPFVKVRLYDIEIYHYTI